MWYLTLLAQTDNPGTTAPAPAAAPPAKDVLAESAERARQDVMNAWQGLRQGDLATAWPLLEKYVLPLAIAVVILIVTVIAAKMLANMARGAARRAKIEETLARFFAKLIFYSVILLGALMAANYVGLPVTSFAAILAAAGFAIGMALSGTLSNFASGALLLIFRPFKVGDVVRAAGVFGKVQEIELFTTVFDTFDNRRIIVPNSEIYGGVIENVTHHPTRRVEVAVGVSYRADLDRTREVLNAACESLAPQRVDGEGRGHRVVLDSLGDSAVHWNVWFWADAAEFLDVKEAVTRAVKQHLDAAGLSIPFPQMDVRLSGKLES